MSLSLRHISHRRTSCSKIGAKSFRRREPCKLSVPSAIKDPKTTRSLDAKEFIRKHILELAPYKSIVPFDVLSEKLNRPTSDIVKLDANENPYGPPPEVFSALKNIEFPHIYPDPESRKLRGLLAQECRIPIENIMIGCGADELIDLVLRAILEPKDVLINTPPTFGMYEFDCSINNGVTVNVPRKPAPSFGIDVKSIKEAVFKNNAKILMITSPNNPDGSVISREEIEELLELPCLVVLDEAYIEFYGVEHSLVGEVPKRQNLIVLRTFSKRAALAGLRVGYGVFPLHLIEFLWRMKQPYNVSVVAELAACAALSNPDYLEDVKNALVSERENMFEMMSKFSFLEPYESQSNFILCRVISGRAEELKNFLESDGVIVRYYSSPPELSGCIRVSVGLPEHTVRLKSALLKYMENSK
ncbi:unnamed protein product [Bathycoccus prasinos]|mmetsp:Transcript_3331/g.11300  ORF Transcript_3331/g.11300 Transcript_3331/m.11300 type:complete len:416 (+) Transcript_3331:1828-3075(+)